MTTMTSTQVAFDRILVPTDFSDVSDRALEYAKSIAKPANSELLLVHVNPPVNSISPPEAGWIDQNAFLQGAEEQLEENGAALRSEGFRANAISVTGPFQDEILSLVKRERVDLIVLGTHGRSGLERLLFGSDAEAVLRNVSCPVLTVGPAAPPLGSQIWRPKDVVCTTTLDPGSAWVAAYAYTLACRLGATFALLHVHGSKTRSGDSDSGSFERALREHLPADLNRNPPLLTVLSDPRPEEKIVDFVRKRSSGLIVMGARTASAPATHLVRGIAPYVLAASSCPVMTLHKA